MAYLTDQIPATGVNLTDLFHIVNPFDISQGNPAGSSYRACFQQVLSSLTGGTSVMIVGPGICSVERCGNGNESCGNYSTVSGGATNTSNGDYSTIGGGRNNTTYSNLTTIGGGQANTSSGYYSFVGGGNSNELNGSHSFIGDGYRNSLTGDYSFIGGGNSNILDGGNSFIGGGSTNIVSGTSSTIGGGESNLSDGDYSFVGGGVLNTSSGIYSFVGGGNFNTSSDDNSTIGGGRCNTSSGYNSTISGGESNTSSGYHSTVSGGELNISTGDYSFVGGGQCNTSSGDSSTIGGGGGNTSNREYSVIGGGKLNTLTGCISTISGGYRNTITTSGSTIGGGQYNTTTGNYSSILGGTGNTVSHNFSSASGKGVCSVSACTFHVNNLAIQDTPITDTQAVTQFLTRDSSTGIIKTKVSPGATVYGLFAQTGITPTISATTAETTIISGGIGSLSVPSNGFNIGDSFRVDMGGVLNTANNQTLRVRVKTGSTLLLDTSGQTISNSSGDIWTMALNFTIQGVGAAGVAKIVTLSRFQYTKTTNGSIQGFSTNYINDTTFDTTSPNTLNVTVEWGSNNSGNRINCDIFVLNKIY